MIRINSKATDINYLKVEGFVFRTFGDLSEAEEKEMMNSPTFF